MKAGMKRRIKYIAALLVLLTAVAATAAASSVNLKLASVKYRPFDAPFLDGIQSFIIIFYNLQRVVIVLATTIGCINIVWNCFKLWLGTEQVKKVCTDIISKFLIFIVAMNVYPLVMGDVLELSMSLGAHASGGYDKVFNAFYSQAKHSAKILSECNSKLKTVLTDGGKGLSDEDVKKILTTSVLKNSEDLYPEVKRAGVRSDQSTYTKISVTGKEKEYMDMGVAVDVDSWMGYDSKTGTYKPLNSYDLSVKEADNESRKITSAASKIIQTNDYQTALDTLVAYDEVFSYHPSADALKADEFFRNHPNYTPVDENGDSIMQSYNQYQYFTFNVFLTYKENGVEKETLFLSPASMLKMGLLVSDILGRRIDGGMVMDEKGYATYEKTTFQDKSNKTLMGKVKDFIMKLVISLGLNFTCIIITIQYVTCILEYILVSSVGCIFIPFCLWDGTKSFAQKLITMFSSYFIKLLMQITCIFWTYAMFLKMGANTIGDGANQSTFWQFTYVVFICFMCIMMNKSAPQFAVALLNGNPQLSLGEFMSTANSIANTARTAQAAGQKTVHAAQAAGKGVQAAGRAAATTGLAFGAASQAAAAAGGGAGNFMKSLGSIAGKGLAHVGQSVFTGTQSGEQFGFGKSNSHTSNTESYRNADGKNNARGTMDAMLGIKGNPENSERKGVDDAQPAGQQGTGTAKGDSSTLNVPSAPDNDSVGK